jgi:hypothetical protein
MPRASGLPFQTWPPADQALWEAAFRASDDPFLESGHASQFTQETRRALRSSYGTFLRFLSAKHPERLAGSPSTRIDRDIAMEYVDWRRPMCGAATIATGLDRLRLVISYIALALTSHGCCRSRSAWQPKWRPDRQDFIS